MVVSLTTRPVCAASALLFLLSLAIPLLLYADVPLVRDSQVLGRVGMVAMWMLQLALMILAEADYLISDLGNDRLQLCSSLYPGSPCETVFSGFSSLKFVGSWTVVTTWWPTVSITAWSCALPLLLLRLALLWVPLAEKDQDRHNCIFHMQPPLMRTDS